MPGDNIKSSRYCSKQFNLINKLDTHEKRHQDLLANNPSPDSYQYDICDKVYKWEQNMTKQKLSRIEKTIIEVENAIEPYAKPIRTYIDYPT